ncbi:MAG: tetratricopeptide repeat protein [Parachlamydiaceae bacterium]
MLFAKVRALKMLGREEEAHKIAKKYLQHPDASLQAEIAFSLYSYQDYLFGDKEAIKHLSQFVKNYSNHPLALNGYYLLGLDLKMERKKVHAKNLTEAADLFLEVEHRFSKIAIPASQYTYYLALKHEASLERAKTLFTLAEEGGDAKKKLYYGYAQEVLNGLENEPLSSNERGELVLLKGSILSRLEENASEYLKNALPSLSKRYRSLASLSLAKWNPQDALIYLNDLDSLPMDEKLSAMLIKSEAYENKGDLDSALSTLSEVINENAVSEKRIEAMYKRAMLYEKQNRQDLAHRQLEACKQKGGEWGMKAAAHLKEKYEQL